MIFLCALTGFALADGPLLSATASAVDARASTTSSVVHVLVSDETSVQAPVLTSVRLDQELPDPGFRLAIEPVGEHKRLAVTVPLEKMSGGSWTLGLRLWREVEDGAPVASSDETLTLNVPVPVLTHKLETTWLRIMPWDGCWGGEAADGCGGAFRVTAVESSGAAPLYGVRATWEAARLEDGSAASPGIECRVWDEDTVPVAAGGSVNFDCYAGGEKAPGKMSGTIVLSAGNAAPDRVDVQIDTRWTRFLFLFPLGAGLGASGFLRYVLGGRIARLEGLSAASGALLRVRQYAANSADPDVRAVITSAMEATEDDLLGAEGEVNPTDPPLSRLRFAILRVRKAERELGATRTGISGLLDRMASPSGGESGASGTGASMLDLVDALLKAVGAVERDVEERCAVGTRTASEAAARLATAWELPAPVQDVLVDVRAALGRARTAFAQGSATTGDTELDAAEARAKALPRVVERWREQLRAAADPSLGGAMTGVESLGFTLDAGWPGLGEGLATALEQVEAAWRPLRSAAPAATVAPAPTAAARVSSPAATSAVAPRQAWARPESIRHQRRGAQWVQTLYVGLSAGVIAIVATSAWWDRWTGSTSDVLAAFSWALGLQVSADLVFSLARAGTRNLGPSVT